MAGTATPRRAAASPKTGWTLLSVKPSSSPVTCIATGANDLKVDYGTPPRPWSARTWAIPSFVSMGKGTGSAVDPMMAPNTQLKFYGDNRDHNFCALEA